MHESNKLLFQQSVRRINFIVVLFFSISPSFSGWFLPCLLPFITWINVWKSAHFFCPTLSYISFSLVMARKTFWIAKNSTRLDLYVACWISFFFMCFIFCLRFSALLLLDWLVCCLFCSPVSSFHLHFCRCYHFRYGLAIPSGNIALNIVQPHKICASNWTLPFRKFSNEQRCKTCENENECASKRTKYLHEAERRI